MSATQMHAADHKQLTPNNIGVELHKKAAECCENAADEHRRAAEYCARGDDAKAMIHAQNAHNHCKQALEHGRQAGPH